MRYSRGQSKTSTQLVAGVLFQLKSGLQIQIQRPKMSPYTIFLNFLMRDYVWPKFWPVRTKLCVPLLASGDLPTPCRHCRCIQSSCGTLGGLAMGTLMSDCPCSSSPSQARPIGIHPSPCPIDKVPDDFCSTCIEMLDSCLLCILKFGLVLLLEAIFDPTPVLEKMSADAVNK